MLFALHISHEQQFTVHNCTVTFVIFAPTDGVCTWPPDFANTSWMDSSKGELLFESETMTGWAFTNGLLTINTWECHTTDYLESHGYLIMK